MSQYNFYETPKVRQGSDINKAIVREKCRNPAEVRDRVLEQYDQYQDLKQNDPKYSELCSEKKRLSDLILKKYGVLQQKDANHSEATVRSINLELNELDEQHKQVSTQAEEYLQDKMSWLRSNYPEIYERLVEGEAPLDRITLEHVLDHFVKSETGVINRREAVSKGLDYMKRQHNLPDDWFDYSKIDQFV